MKMQKVLEFNGMSFELLLADRDKEDFPRERFRAILRIKNISISKKKIAIKEDGTKYISIKHGLEYAYHIKPYQFALTDGTFILPDSFADVTIQFDVVKEAQNGDRMEIELRDLALLPLVKWDGQWYWGIDEIEDKRISSNSNRELTYEEKKSLKKQLKSKIEYFESIDEKFGLSLQNFSFDILDNSTLKLFCEVLALNGEVPKEGFNVEVAIYDTDNDIICLKSISKYDNEFKGFEVFGFGPIKLDIPVDEIGKIRFYPTR